ncbi:hypothetical protein [Ktedonobacter racemifer]|nr:hypothetical protein [Ktedonobacter racemifer]
MQTRMSNPTTILLAATQGFQALLKATCISTCISNMPWCMIGN